MKIFWSSQARKDLRAIRAYIAKDSTFYAERVVTRIIERAEILSRHPNAGHPVHEAPDLDVREVHAGSHRIIYRVLLDEIEIVTLVHCAQRLNTKRLR